MTIADINLEIRALCDADSTSYPDAVLLRRVNAAYEQVIGKIIGIDGTWQFDDSNFTNLPIAVTDLVDDQQDYSFDVTQLNIERVEVKDINGLWYLLSPIDKSQVTMALGEYLKTKGLPDQYDKNGESIFLYPPPSSNMVTLVSGLKVYFQRTASIFTSAEVTTGTKVPGFASPFHMLICYMAAIPYCATYKKDRVPLYLAEIQRIEADMLAHYALREKDIRKQLTMSGISFR